MLTTGYLNQSEGIRICAASLSLLQHGLEGRKEKRDVRAGPRPRLGAGQSPWAAQSAQARCR
ncbi:unnamed protein product [Gulo gulo]|uniref:Uncharacterized protein n=1 Tax=Gulo gulo TaxID=48420 RepID=A0A9X9Q1C3_GULGU|nr:unnamed protein product [Gulo gulo]